MIVITLIFYFGLGGQLDMDAANAIFLGWFLGYLDGLCS